MLLFYCNNAMTYCLAKNETSTRTKPSWWTYQWAYRFRWPNINNLISLQIAAIWSELQSQRPQRQPCTCCWWNSTVQTAPDALARYHRSHIWQQKEIQVRVEPLICKYRHIVAKTCFCHSSWPLGVPIFCCHNAYTYRVHTSPSPSILEMTMHSILLLWRTVLQPHGVEWHDTTVLVASRWSSSLQVFHLRPFNIHFVA